jgi:hypothetical protein
MQGRLAFLVRGINVIGIFFTIFSDRLLVSRFGGGNESRDLFGRGSIKKIS